MHRVDIVISNDRHHCAMARPLARRMLETGSFSLRVLSLCEFRGISTPQDPLGTGAPVLRLSAFRRPRGIKQKALGSQPENMISRASRTLAWWALLARSLNKALRFKPDLVILFNDAAFPYDRLTKLLHEGNIPFLLVQEGIRFEATETAIRGAIDQGRGGAAAIAVFGESSAEFFLKQGAQAESIHLTGNPRFDDLFALDLKHEVQEARMALNLGNKNLLFLSNPIEFHGYCTTDEKLKLVSDFIVQLAPLFEDEEFRLVFKLHGQENPDDFLEAASASPHSSQIVMATGFGLYPLLEIGNAAVIFGTTAGLEALLFGVPLGVLEIPGVGFLHDYVREGAGMPLRWSENMGQQVGKLLDRKGRNIPEVDRYLKRSLASRTGATERVVELVEKLLSPSMPPRVHGAGRDEREPLTNDSVRIKARRNS